MDAEFTVQGEAEEPGSARFGRTYAEARALIGKDLVGAEDPSMLYMDKGIVDE